MPVPSLQTKMASISKNTFVQNGFEYTVYQADASDTFCPPQSVRHNNKCFLEIAPSLICPRGTNFNSHSNLCEGIVYDPPKCNHPIFNQYSDKKNTQECLSVIMANERCNSYAFYDSVTQKCEFPNYSDLETLDPKTYIKNFKSEIGCVDSGEYMSATHQCLSEHSVPPLFDCATGSKRQKHGKWDGKKIINGCGKDVFIPSKTTCGRHTGDELVDGVCRVAGNDASDISNHYEPDKMCPESFSLTRNGSNMCFGLELTDYPVECPAGYIYDEHADMCVGKVKSAPIELCPEGADEVDFSSNYPKCRKLVTKIPHNMRSTLALKNPERRCPDVINSPVPVNYELSSTKDFCYSVHPNSSSLIETGTYENVEYPPYRFCKSGSYLAPENLCLEEVPPTPCMNLILEDFPGEKFDYDDITGFCLMIFSSPV